MRFSRREFVFSATAGASGLFLPRHLRAAEPPTSDPTAHLELTWTKSLPWARVLDITTISAPARSWDQRLSKAQATLAAQGGGVVYFPRGKYDFHDHIYLRDGIVLRGAEPAGGAGAHDANYQLGTRLEFPRYRPKFTGSGAPIDTAFRGIYLENPAGGGNCGVVNLDINRGHIHLAEDQSHRCGANRIVYGCILRNAAVADPKIPNDKLAQHPWQRFTARHHAAIDVKASENILVANNRLPASGDDNFAMDDFRLKPTRGGPDRFDGVVFDYDNRPGIYVCHYCVGGAGGSGDDGTPQTYPWGFRSGIVIRDNYVFNTGRTAIGFSGDGTLCANNVIRFAKDVWRPTTTGDSATSGSSTNDNRAVEMRGWRWVVDGNNYQVHRNWASDRRYLINDGEGLMHEDHCNSDIRDSRLVNNRGNSYLSIYKCGAIDGLSIQGNDISTPGEIDDIYVVADRNSGRQPCRNVMIIDNTTRSNGIRLAGSPAADNQIRNNRHTGSQGVIHNQAHAKLSGNQGYRVESD